MKHFSKVLGALIAAMLLTLPACGKADVITCYPAEEETGTETAVMTAQVAEWDTLPIMKIHYEDEEWNASATLTPSKTYVWTATMSDGSWQTAEHSGARPCEQENRCTVWSADTVGEVRLALHLQAPYDTPDIEGAEFYTAESAAVTVTAYPAAEDGTVDLSTSQSVPVADGCFPMLVGWYYYEIEVKIYDGVVTYGFLGYRIHAEEYRVTEHQDGCFVSYDYEDPDHITKTLARLSLSTQLGHDWRSGINLAPKGRIVKRYTNHAGTAITMVQENGDPMADDNIYTIDQADLAAAWKVEFDTKQKVTHAFYHRYDLSGTHLEGDVVISTGDEITFKENSYYVFTVTYEDGTAQYVLKTGEADIPPHPLDDPSISPEVAALVRSAFHRGYYGDSKPAEDVYIVHDLGNFGGMEAVIMSVSAAYLQSESPVEVAGYTIESSDCQKLYLYYVSRFYTIEQAYQYNLITKADVYEIGKLVDSTFESRYPMP